VLYATICCWNKSFLSLISANAKEIKLETYFMKIRNCSRTITIWSKAISLGEMRDCFKDRIVRSGSKMPDIYKYLIFFVDLNAIFIKCIITHQ
jgi:hypothetical protein